MQIAVAARLHDLGKMFFTESIFSSALPFSSLDEPQRRIIKMHPVWGAMFLELFPGFGNIIPMVKHHHERLDGSGYPDGLRGNAIPFGARLLSVIDTFDAMTTPRNYEKQHSIEEALAYLRDNSRALFDAQVVEAVVAIHALKSQVPKTEFSAASTKGNGTSSPVVEVAAAIERPLDFQGVDVTWFGRKGIVDLGGNRILVVKFAHQLPDGTFNPNDIGHLELLNSRDI